MYQYFYASTKDRKGHVHNYKLTNGDTVPSSHEIVDLSVASRFKFSEIIRSDQADALAALFPRKSR